MHRFPLHYTPDTNYFNFIALTSATVSAVSPSRLPMFQSYGEIWSKPVPLRHTKAVLQRVEVRTTRRPIFSSNKLQ